MLATLALLIRELTWGQMDDAGYRPRKDGVMFINEKDFNGRW